ncbi:MAG: DUF4402 domain-containing protein [bacterium]
MKKIIFLCTLLVCSLFTFAQASATATSSGLVVEQIAISKTTDMNFGNMAASPLSGVITLYSNSTRVASGGVVLPATSGTVAAAQFAITGFPNSTYAITLPSSCVLDKGSDHMTSNNFTSSPSTTGQIDGNGNSTLSVGADLLVGANQPAGQYLSTVGFTVSVNYN